MICLIAAVGKNNELGIDNHLIWDIPGDLKFFKKVTINHTIVMGRKTFESIGRALPNRYNIVISKSLDNTCGVEVVTSFEEILRRFKDVDQDIFIVGGASLYNYFAPYAEKIYLTEVDAEAKADVYFPQFEKNNFVRINLGENSDNGINYQHILYRRKKK